MDMAKRASRFMIGFVMSYGPKGLKQRIWDREYASNKWHFIDNTVGDCVYPYLEKYTQNGSILDLGCGPGNTANELAEKAYRTYLGMDISEEALAKAAARTKAAGRSHKNRFTTGDFLRFEPNEQFDVILFRESMYHVPLNKVKSVLQHYSKCLTDRGVIIVRMYLAIDGKGKFRPTKMVDIIEKNYDVIEKGEHGGEGAATVVVFRPRQNRVN
jgi:SAM-dependent methyltransferase